MRIVGLPGARVSIDDGIVSIDGQPIAEPYLVEANRSHEAMAPRQLGDQEYFVMGDNRRNASDSREWARSLADSSGPRCTRWSRTAPRPVDKRKTGAHVCARTPADWVDAA
jgi:hypothetical protein